MFRRNFLFGEDSGTANVIGVWPEDLYQPGKGYGFLVEQNRREQELLWITELNSGFEPLCWYQDRDLTRIEEDSQGLFLSSDAVVSRLEEEAGAAFLGEHRRIPLTFVVDVPRQGNYKLTVTIRADEPMRDVMLFTGRRRLAYRGDIPGGTVFRHTMTVNVCDIVPRGQTRIYSDTTVDLTVVADRPRISSLSVEEISCPTVYIAGDSTVTDQSAEYPYAPGTSYAGWGQMLTAYLDGRIAVSNHAHSGLTTESFRREGHYAVIEQYCRPGDFLFFQFGHNDQKLSHLTARGGYLENLLRYVGECRERGVYPVLVTPLARNSWKGNDGSYNDLLAEYARICVEAGRQENVPVLDLHGRSMAFIKEKGLEGAKPYFYPDDFTHSNDYGAYYMAGLLARELKDACQGHTDLAYRFLAGCVTDGYGPWEPAGTIAQPVRPKGLAGPPDTQLLSEVDRLQEPADRAAALEMLIKTARFFPTNVYNDAFEDVVGHEWYAGIVECACQNGMIDPALVAEGKFFPLQPVTMEEFLVFAMNGYRSRKTLPEEQPCIYDEKCRDFARPYVRAAYALGLVAADGSEDLGRVATRGELVAFCRKMGI